MDRTLTPVIDWDSEQTHFLLNPKLAPEALAQAERIMAEAQGLKGHLWVQSSGSSQKSDESAKWIALSKAAFLASAKGVNQHLQSTSQDRWGIALPLFHVSGLSILARASLTGAATLHWESEWRAADFLRWLEDKAITLLSMVPTQLFDLLQLSEDCPPSLRAVILGGARLEASLYEKAREKGWPVLPSFGMTEFCSQIATARVGSPELVILPHIQARVDGEAGLWLQSPALYTGFMQERQGQMHWETPSLVEGFWKTPDRARIEGVHLTPLGRDGEFIKIKGEGLDLTELRSRFQAWLSQKETKVSPQSFALAAISDPRAGTALVLAIEGQVDLLMPLVELWNQSCFPIERLRAQRVSQIPRSSLGKVRWMELSERLH